MATRYAAELNGFDSIALTKLDVLDALEEIKVCVGYEINGKRVDTFPAVGDVDGDGVKEIVVVGTDPADPLWSAVYVFEGPTGRLEGMRRLSGGVPYGSAPALAQLDGACGVEGGRLEIIVQTEPTIEVITWDGSSFDNRAGFPKTWHASQWIGDSSPVVGDVDGDQSPDIVFTGQFAGQGTDGTAYAYSASGSTLSG